MTNLFTNNPSQLYCPRCGKTTPYIQHEERKEELHCSMCDYVMYLIDIEETDIIVEEDE